MAILAIAGGTGGVGKTVVEQLQLHGSRHTVFILSRKVPTDIPPNFPQFLKVDYADVDGLVKILEDHKVDTVVSTINLETDVGSQAQLNLIDAAEKSQTTRRFIPSEFVPLIDQENQSSGPGFGGWAANAQALKKTGLEYIRISIGFFSDYWGMPHIKTNLKPFHLFLDMERSTVVVPGSGDNKFSIVYSEDLARVIVRLLDVESRWPEVGLLSGSDISMNEVIDIAEKVRGSKLHVIHDTVEKLNTGEATVLRATGEYPEEQFKALVCGFSQTVIAGGCLLPQDERRLDKLFSDIPLTSIEELLTKAWKGK